MVRSVLSAVVAAVLVIAAAPAPASATWSVIAVDARTGRIVIASATCVTQARLEGFPARGLMDVQAIVVPGVGVAAAQAGVDRTRANQRLIHAELRRGTHPARILTMLREDPDIQRRQFGIVDLEGRFVGFSGGENGAASLSVQGHVPGTEIYYSIQGNILASDEVVHDAVDAFAAEGGSLTDRVMAAMDAADAAGGDVRCTCETEPVPQGPCHGRTAHVAYLLAADGGDPEGESFNDGEYALYLNVTDQNLAEDEDANPVLTLRARYEALPEELRRDPEG
ncbi:MAG: DUF1028 domain-containing protein [Gemmatimonadota bacterium]|nr:DUF1028 domain-containing protein [Gemmatimonadota bacterium]